MATFKTTDLCDAHPDAVQVAEPLFKDFGGRRAFEGRICTVRAPDDNSLVKAALDEPGAGRVLVVDGAGSTRCALVGDQLGQAAVKNGWAGVVVFGCVRDVEVLTTLGLGVRALAAFPRKSHKRGLGEREVVLEFAGVTFRPSSHLYADENGLIVAERKLA